MTEHVLECRWESQRCICTELRACEQRVLGMRLDDLNAKSFNAALDAAAQAVENMKIEWAWNSAATAGQAAFAKGEAMSASVSDRYGSAHDPLCPTFRYPDDHCQCHLIAKVREDERCKAELHNYHMPAWTAGFAKGYADALDAAETAVAEALKERMLMADCSPNTMRAPLFAIRALKEKP